jgi:hypothetical protein
MPQQTSDLATSLYGQFGRPTGFPGWLAGKLMASREGNQRRNRWTVELLQVAPTDHVLEIG